MTKIYIDPNLPKFSIGDIVLVPDIYHNEEYYKVMVGYIVGLSLNAMKEVLFVVKFATGHEQALHPQRLTHL